MPILLANLEMSVLADKKVGCKIFFSKFRINDGFVLGERRRKQAESQLPEISAKLADVERSRNELQDKIVKLHQEIENILQQLEESELK